MLGDSAAGIDVLVSSLPATVSGWLLLICYAIFLVALLLRARESFASLSLPKWALLLLLAAVSLVIGLPQDQFVALFFPQQPPTFVIEQHEYLISLLSAVPYLLAGVFLGTGPAIVVGFIAGLGLLLNSSGQLYDPFHVAFAAWLAAVMIGQRYQGRLYGWLRVPLISGTISQFSLVIFAALATLVNTAGLLDSFEASLAVFVTELPMHLLIGAVSGGLVTIMARILVQWLPPKRLIPPPSQRSLRTFLLSNFVIYAALILTLSIATVFGLSVFIASRSLVTQMAAASNASLSEIEELQTGLTETLSRYGHDKSLSNADKVGAASKLGHLYHNAEFFDEVLLLDNQLSVIYQYPAQERIPALTPEERAAAKRGVGEGLKGNVLSEGFAGDPFLSLIVPVEKNRGDLPRALLARIKVEKFAEHLTTTAANQERRSLINRDSQVISATGNPQTAAFLLDAAHKDARELFVPAYLGGEAYLVKNNRESHDLYYLSPANSAGWRVASAVTFERPLTQAFATSLPVVLIILAISGLFYVRFSAFGQNVTQPVKALSQTSWDLIAGKDVQPSLDMQRHDEIGELSRAVYHMQRSLRGMSEELKLLLSVTNDVAASQNIAESMPVILRAAIRGTGAVAARIIIRSPQGRIPLTFAEGPQGEACAVLDNPLLHLMQDASDLTIPSAKDLRQQLRYVTGSLPVKALYALALPLRTDFSGLLVLGFTESRQLSADEKRFLQTLSSHASVMIEQVHLYATAEGGRQRLRAVLSSTSEAILVTDRNERILLLNKAFERAFDLRMDEAIGSKAADIIQSERLTRAIGDINRNYQNIEVTGSDGRVNLANIATIRDQRRQLLGRVAVLHDVTELRQAERMKSEFVSNVSHDLKTPMTVISGLASALTFTDSVTEEQEVIAKKIIREVEHMADLVDNLLDLGKLDAGVPLEVEEFAIAGFLSELVDNHWLHAHQNGVRLRAKASAQLPPVTADKAWLYQALSNLLANGFKYAPNSGDMILSAVKVDENIVFSLHDNGPGIDKEEIDHLFDRFYRGSAKKKPALKGSGLGLAIVKSVSERHGGYAWCQSEPGKGSTFSVSIPIKGSGEVQSLVSNSGRL